MKVAVCIKQVPAEGSTRMNPETGNLVRTGAGAMLNPCDRHAIAAALQVARACGAKLTAFTMGPAGAEKVLREALALGADDAVLLCGSHFAGADVYATAYTLKNALLKAGGFDAVLCGQQTTDGDTAETPFSLAAQLDIPAVGWVKSLARLGPEGFCVLQEATCGTQEVRGAWPALFAISPDAAAPGMPTLAAKLAAGKKPLEHWKLEDLPDTNLENYGLRGSPTRVKRIYSPDKTAKAALIEGSAGEAAARILAAVGEAKGGRPHG